MLWIKSYTEKKICMRFYPMKKKPDQPLEIFRKHKGLLRTSEAIKLGVHPRELYALQEEGALEQLDRGVFRLSSEPDFSEPDLVLAAKRIPKGIVCLISALSFYGLTTQIPHYVYLALPRTSRTPRSGYPPLRCFRYSEDTYHSGMKTIAIDGFPIKIYSVEKTLADCLKFRNKIGMDIVLEALKEYWRRGDTNLDELFKYAKICRVEKILEPIIETIVSQ